MNKRRAALAVTGLLALILVVAGPVAAADDSWHYTVTPYLWAPTINGSFNSTLPPGVGDGDLNTELGPHDYLSNLKMAFLVSGEARKGRHSVATDVVYLSFANEKGNVRSVDFGGDRVPVEVTVNRDTESSLKGKLVTLVGGYSLNGDSEAPIDVIAGFRYFGVRTSVDWKLTGTVSGPGGSGTLPATGSLSRDTDLWDGIVGLRGRGKISERWHVPYYVDLGTGTSSLTWQAMAGVTYTYHWGDVGLVYRHLSYDQDDDETLQNISFSGPAVNFAFHF
jgi:hypothetical protein